MKKISRRSFLYAGAAMSAALALSACGANAGSGSGASQAGQARTVRPLPGTLSVDALDDCTFAAGFTAPDVYLDDDGVLVAQLEVFDYERFDAVDIAALAPGDTLVIDGREMAVQTVEASGSGWYEINGGLEEGGCYLACGEDGGTFYQVLEDDARSYFSLGTATLRISQEFVYTDASDLEQPARTLYAGDFLQEMEQAAADGAEICCTPYCVTATTQGGWLTAIDKRFVP